jgi:anti-anti-sigma factor
MLDLRELTFIDRSAVDVIVDAAVRARRRGGRLMLARGPAEVDRLFTLTGACDQVLIIDLDPAEPARTLLEAA